MNTSSSLLTTLQMSLPTWVPTICDPTRPYVTDHDKMRLAIALSRNNVSHNTGGPFGAAVFRSSDHTLVAVGVNSVEPLHNSALHAELFALMLAEASVSSHTLNSPDLPRHELFTSCAPCAMCVGGILWSGVRRVVVGADRDDAQRIGFDEGPVFPESYRYLEERGIEFVRGVLAHEAREVLEFYRQRGGLIYNG